MAAYRAANLRITGLKEIKQTLASMTAEIDGKELYEIMGEAVRPIQRQAQLNISYLSVSVRNSIYIADKQPPSRPSKKTVLVVVHKKDTMREWTASKLNRSPRAKVGPGAKVAESLGTMFELGTTPRCGAVYHGDTSSISEQYGSRSGISKGMLAHFWFRNAADSKRGDVAMNLKEGLSGLIERVIAKRQIPSA